MLKKRVNNSQQSYTNRSKPVNSEKLVNMYAERVLPSSKTEYVMHGTPGLKVFADLGTSQPVYGIHAFGNYIYAVSDNTCFTVDSGGGVSTVGSSGATYNDVQIEDNGVEVLILNNATGVAHIATPSTIVELTNPDFRSASSVTYLDGYLIFSEKDTSTFFISALRDASSYNALDFATAEANPDNIVRVFATYKLLYLFGTISTEIWYNSGNADFPFESYQSGVFQVGLAGTLAVTQISDTIGWLGDDRSIYATKGSEPERISTPAIDEKIRKFSTVSDCVAFSYAQEGHDFMGFTFPTADATLVYDLVEGKWHERKSWEIGRWRGNNCTFAFGKYYIGDYTNGKIYELDLDTYFDNVTGIIEREGIIPPLFNDGNSIFLDRLEFDFESGTGLITGQGTNPQVMVKRSVDGGRTFGNELWATIGAMGNYRQICAFRKLGTANNMTYKWRITDPIKVSGAAIYALLSGGES